MLRIFRFILKRKYSYLIFFVLLFSPYNLKKIQSSNLDIAPKSVSEENLINRNSSQILTNEYLLGPGDTLFINFKETPIFSGVYTINNESIIFLPELNRFKVNKISAVDLEKELNLRYKQFIYRPDIRVSIQSYRNVNVYIRGAVKRPGLYSFVGGFINSDKNLLNYSSMSLPTTNNIRNESGGQTFKITTIFDVIKASQGFNLNADLTDVVVIRDNSTKQGGGKIYTKVNLLSFLLEGDQTQNIRIYDGDNILIKNGISINEQIVNLNRINISPEIMSVYVSGNVNSPGRKDLKQNSHLLQALASAGGKKNLTGSVKFLRFNLDGTIDRRQFKIDQNAPINSEKNPILLDGDIINVERSLLGKTTSALNEISSPLITGFSIYNIFSD